MGEGKISRIEEDNLFLYFYRKAVMRLIGSAKMAERQPNEGEEFSPAYVASDI